jgi:hypothetical protein
VEWRQEQWQQGWDSVCNNHLVIPLYYYPLSSTESRHCWGGLSSCLPDIPFAEAMVDVVCCSWAVPDHLRTSVEMTFLLWSGACRAGDGGGCITLQ